jgi:hypothetical protein
MSAGIAAFSDTELREELHRREVAEAESRWKKAIENAKYLCDACGGPDGWHNRGCPSDELDTCT